MKWKPVICKFPGDERTREAAVDSLPLRLTLAILNPRRRTDDGGNVPLVMRRGPILRAKKLSPQQTAFRSRANAREYLEKRKRSPEDIAAFVRSLDLARDLVSSAKREVERRALAESLTEKVDRLRALGYTAAAYSGVSHVPERVMALRLLHGAPPEHNLESLDDVDRDIATAVFYELRNEHNVEKLSPEAVGFALARIYSRLRAITPPSSTEMAIVEVIADEQNVLVNEELIAQDLARWKKRVPNGSHSLDEPELFMEAVANAVRRTIDVRGGSAESYIGDEAEFVARYSLPARRFARLMRRSRLESTTLVQGKDDGTDVPSP